MLEISYFISANMNAYSCNIIDENDFREEFIFKTQTDLVQSNANEETAKGGNQLGELILIHVYVFIVFFVYFFIIIYWC